MDKLTGKQAERNICLDFLRGIAILIVLFNHAIQANQINDNFLSTVFTIVLSFQMPLLFLVSGYTLGFSINDSYSTFIKKKIKRLLLPYLCWMTIHYLLSCIMPGDYRNFAFGGIIREVFLSDFWFLRALFWYDIIFFIIKIVLQRLNTKLLIANFIGCFCGLIPATIVGRIPFFSEFTIGAWHYLWICLGFAVYLIQRGMAPKQFKTVRIILEIVSFPTIAAVLYFGSLLPKRIIGSILVISISSISIVVCRLCSNYIRKIVVDIGKNTLPIYAIHWCLLFSPLWRIGFYHRIWGGKFYGSFITAVCWLCICFWFIHIIKKSELFSRILLGK
nr:acyltransferase family protein [uncultured Acetatifactor sp.]